MSTMFHSTASASSTADSSSPCKPARGVVRPAELNRSIYSILPFADFEFFASSVSVPYLVGKCAMRIACCGFDCVTLFNFTDRLLTFWLFFIQNFRLRNRPPVHCSQFKAIHSMRRGAGRGKPDGPKRLPIALGFKCVHCGHEFDSQHAIDVHRRHSTSVGTPCADPRNHKSMSVTCRGDQAAGILRQHDTLGVLPIPDVCFAQKMLTSTFENSEIVAIIAIIKIIVIIVS